jgi:tetratricopeptide (TPR) repeat protein
VRLLAISVAVVAVAAVGGYFWRAHQLNGMADAWLARADELEKDRPRQAVVYLRRYLNLRPEDSEVQIRTAKLLDLANDYGAAIQQYYRALGLEPERHELRRRLIELLLVDNRIASAEVEARELLRKPGQTGDLVAKRALALVALAKARRGDTKSYKSARDEMQKVLAQQPGDVDLASELAEVFRRSAVHLGMEETQAAKEADAVMERMIAARATDPTAFLRRYDYRRKYGLAGARQDLEKAVTLGPKDARVLLKAGDFYLAPTPERDVKRARECFEQAVAAAPESMAAHWGLGQALMVEGDSARAIAAWEKGRESAADPGARLFESLIEAYIATGQLTEADRILNELKKKVEKMPLRQAIGGRMAIRRLVARLEAQLFLARKEWARAVPLLKQVLDTEANARSGSLAVNEFGKARELLAQAYAAMECWDLAAAEYDELTMQPLATWRHPFFAGEIWRKAGQIDRAISSFERATAMPGVPAAIWVNLAQAHLELQLTRPDAKLRDWRPFRAAYERAKGAGGSWQLRWMAAMYQATQDDTDGEKQKESRAKAVAILRDGEKIHPNEREYWARLVRTYERLGQPADADRALARYRELETNSIGSISLEVQLLAMRGRFDAAETRLARALAEEPERTHLALRYQQMVLAFESRREDVGRERLKELLRLEPANVRLLRQATEIALEAGDMAEVERLAASLESVEGRSGAISKTVRARKLLLESIAAKTPPPVEVDQLVAELREQRPNWAPAACLAALLAERRGDVKLAANLYQRAIDLGDRRVATYERLILMLFGQNRLTEAQAVLDQMGRTAMSNERLESVAMLVAARQDRGDQAVELARQSVNQHPKDAMRRLWLAQMLHLTDRNAEALTALEEAIQLAPTDAGVWNALFTFHRRTGNPAAAEKTLRELGEKAKLTAAQKEFALGQGFELLGKRKEAEEHYRQAFQLSPDDATVAVRLAAIVAATNLEEAEKILKGVIERGENTNDARRALAVLLAMRDGESSWATVQELLQTGNGDEGNPAENDRLQALLAVNRSRTRKQRLDSYAEARKLIEARIERAKTVDAADRVLLAGLYEGEAVLLADASKLDLARAQFRPLVDAADPAETHVRLYANFLLRHARGKLLSVGDKAKKTRQSYLADAQRHINHLEAKERTDKRLATPRTLLLRAQWLKQSDRAAEIPEAINTAAEKRLAAAEKENTRLQFILEVGQVYSAVELEPEAEKWYRKAMAISDRTYVALAQCLARQNKLADALTLCQDAAKNGDDPQPAIIAANLLTTAGTTGPGAPEFSPIEPMLTNALARHSSNAELLFAVAILRTVQERVDEAIGLFERVVKVAPKHVLALNNLSTLLAEHPQRRREALEYIDRAIGLVGPQGALLDTKGTVLLLEGNDAEAVACLEEAVDAVITDPRFSFHLAAAYQRIGRAADARTAFRRALENGLDKSVLTAGDRELRVKLENNL